MNESVERGRVSAIGCFVVALALHAIDATGVVRAQQPQQSIAIQVVQVRPNVWLLAGAGANIVVHLGWMGVVLVDAGSAEMSDQVLTAIQRGSAPVLMMKRMRLSLMRPDAVAIRPARCRTFCRGPIPTRKPSRRFTACRRCGPRHG